MPPELLPIYRKDFLKERKPSSSEPVEIVPARWRESPTTPSSHPNNHGPLSCRWGGGGPSDLRGPFTGPSQKDHKGGNFWETTASPNGNSHPQSDFVNSWVQLQSNDQHKNNNGGVRITGGQSQTLDWKPLKWVRSGSLSSRGSESPQLGNSNLVQSPPGDTAPCVTPDEANSRKKARLGWGEGLAKFEKKKVDPDDIIDKDNGPKCGSVDDVSSSSCLFACSSSPVAVDNETCNASNVFNLENLELTENFSMNSSLDELLQSDDTGFATEKLQVWKADVTRTLEITETNIDSLENELKSLTPASEIQKPVEDSVAMAKLTETNSVATEKTDSVTKLYDAILASNKVIAKQACDEISKILPTTDKTCANIIRVNDDVSSVEKRIYTRKRFLKFKEKVTTLKFRAFHYSWKKDLHKLLSVRKNGAKPSSRAHTRSCSPVPTEYVKKLLSDTQVKPCRNVQKMPTFILDKSVRTISRFISDNGLVENPIEVEKEKSIVKPWTEEDKNIFLEKYGLFGKNFKKISSFLPNKTVADCVEFYYKNHKSDLFHKTKKKPKSYTANTYLLTSGKQRLNLETRATSSLDVLGAASAILSDQTTDFSMFCDDQETAAADVLAGICGSISPEEALGSCVTSLADNNRVRSCQKIKEEMCSDDSCGEDLSCSHWTDEEKLSFVKAVRVFGKDFLMVSRCVGTRSGDQCKVYFSKVRGILGLDFENWSEGTTGANQGGSDPDHDHDDRCMVDSGSGISNDDPSTVDLRTSDCRESEDSASGAKVEEIRVCSDSEINFDLNTVSENVETVDSFVMPNLFPKKEVDDVSSRLSFRKSGQRSSSIDLKLLMPRDGCLQMSTDTMTPVPVHENPSRSGDVKLFGQILTKSDEKPNNSKFDNCRSYKDFAFGVKNNLELNRRSYGVWDGNKIQSGLSSLPDSAVLLAKYPAAFAGTEQCNMNNVVVSGSYRGAYGQGFTVDKLLPPEVVAAVARRKELEGCNAVSDPVAAIRMHYAKTEHYNKVSDIGSR